MVQRAHFEIRVKDIISYWGVIIARSALSLVRANWDSSLPPPPLPDRCNYFYRAANALRYASAAHGVFELLICKRISKVEKKTRLKRISG